MAVYSSDCHLIIKRDFLRLSATTTGLTGTAIALWPFIDSMNPAEDVKAFSTTEVSLDSIEIGQRITTVWRGKPIFIVHRSPAQIERAIRDDDSELPDPQKDIDRVQRSEWLVLIGICTHLGCTPLGQKNNTNTGDFGGWFCPCHGSHYDMSGRIRKGPAPKNLVVPSYFFTNKNTILIGQPILPLADTSLY